MKTKISSLLISSTFLLFTCKKGEEIKPTKFQIDKEFKTYFLSFLKEAALRNIKIDTTNLILTSGVQNTKSKETCGTCYVDRKNPRAQKTVEIFINSPTCWQYNTINAREALVFHELGHCLLGRFDHKTDTFIDGTAKSLMHPTYTDLYSPCVYAIDNDTSCNKTERRKYYIDELFDLNTPKPIWAINL